MPDPRFFESKGALSLEALAKLTGATLSDPAKASIEITVAAPLGRAGADGVSFLAGGKHLTGLAATRAGACFVSPRHAADVPAGCVALIADYPQAAWAKAAAALHAPRRHPAAAPAIHPDAAFEEDVELGPGVVVGPGAQIGRGTRIGAGAVIGPGVAIGRDCDIGPRVVVGFALVGDRVRLHAGSVVGEAGFGTAASPKGPVDIPQLGRVILQDGVTLGANSCVDRGAWEDTSVGENSKIDNLVHVAHNVSLGRNCLLAAYTGISGSVTVGDGVMFGGKAGVADHLNVGAGAVVGASASVFKNIPAAETWTGFPARPIKRWMRETAWVSRAANRRGGEGE
ncbi:MAG: UDP-3-O-(3-hydroxymyristoyl)glucosamine N-acyltransferase [Caulobacterales bacterium]|nr:UDP-3-O-(3-hydroxymyristoyl)glucosamine N-acyltransferase [Caulobacterales bacterium]